MAGLLVFAEVIVRLLVPSYRRAVGGTLTFGIILVGIGLGNLFGWPIVGAVVLIAIGVLVDTLETATTWSNLMSVYEAMTAALKSAIAASGGGPGAVLTHVSHAYPHGASLYSTFLGRQTSPDPSAGLRAPLQ